jgi:hypothetical protein
MRFRSISVTKSAFSFLLKKIPVRTHYSSEDRNTPGFCQTDTGGL